MTAGLRRDAAVALLALGAVLCWELAGLDLAVSGWFGDAGGFRWRDAWLAATLLHGGGRLAAWGLLLFVAVDTLRPLHAGPGRAERGYWLAVSVACLLVVPWLKRASHSSCPWDLAPFGGLAAYVPHWRPGPGDGGPGHCFPSGHATAAFAFFGRHFLWRRHRPAAARRWGVAVGLAGLAFGGVQVVRGAHFVSHVLWSAWICWALCVAAAAAAPRLFDPCRSHALGGRPSSLHPLADEP